MNNYEDERAKIVAQRRHFSVLQRKEAEKENDNDSLYTCFYKCLLVNVLSCEKEKNICSFTTRWLYACNVHRQK